MRQFNNSVERIADKATEGQLVDSRLLKVGEAMNKLHSAYCFCDSFNRATFRQTIGKMTVMEVIEMFGELDHVSENVKEGV